MSDFILGTVTIKTSGGKWRTMLDRETNRPALRQFDVSHGLHWEAEIGGIKVQGTGMATIRQT